MHGLKQIPSAASLATFGPDFREAHGSAELKSSGMLIAGDFEGPPERLLDDRHTVHSACEKQLTFSAMELGCKPVFSGAIHQFMCHFYRVKSLVELMNHEISLSKVQIKLRNLELGTCRAPIFYSPEN
jgi:hypothetical protein